MFVSSVCISLLKFWRIFHSHLFRLLIFWDSIYTRFITESMFPDNFNNSKYKIQKNIRSIQILLCVFNFTKPWTPTETEKMKLFRINTFLLIFSKVQSAAVPMVAVGQSWAVLSLYSLRDYNTPASLFSIKGSDPQSTLDIHPFVVPVCCRY